MSAPLKTAVSAASAISSATTTTSAFTPRTLFEVSPSITRSYFLGHHAGALSSMRKALSNISLILECRDSRVPLTSTNPLLEHALADRDRVIVYTKSDLCAPGTSTRWSRRQHELLAAHHAAGKGGARTAVAFTDERDARSVRALLGAVRQRAVQQHALTGLRALVVGMPNAGKSTLLNALRRVGMALPNAARTGAQPGITRKMGSPVRVAPEDSGAGVEGGVFVVDTPGVFVPYVGDVEAMLKLSLVGCVKDGLVPAETVADYLLFRLNLRDPGIYAELSAPTNDAAEWLENVAVRTGKLRKGGVPSLDAAADWVVQQWRKGNLGRFGLDEVSEESLRARAEREALGAEEHLSMNQARKREKENRKVKNAAKRAAAEGG
ncbi:P-loop containing nucleoside triphosphate hydrolase protein [Whalleya microplaca]|nr:P-loop containing nucleoside triphosphate hydrolase protein [Whalleya microplaca]